MWGWVLVVVVLGLGLWYFASQQQQSSAPTQTVSPTAVMKKEVSPTGADKMMKKEETVNLTADGFNPQTLTVKVGTKVVWTNSSGARANVSSAVHPTHQLYPPLNLGNFEDGEEVSLTFEEAGTYKYHNHLNPSQTGTVVVE